MASQRAVAYVATGGVAGASLRYLLGVAVPGLPGTLAANALGSLALSALLYAGALGGRRGHVVGTGLLSSFTTYSTFAVETATAPGWLPAANVAATYGFAFAGVLLGRALGRRGEGR